MKGKKSELKNTEGNICCGKLHKIERDSLPKSRNDTFSTHEHSKVVQGCSTQKAVQTCGMASSEQDCCKSSSNGGYIALFL